MKSKILKYTVLQYTCVLSYTGCQQITFKTNTLQILQVFECSPATRVAQVRFPANANLRLNYVKCLILFLILVALVLTL